MNPARFPIKLFLAGDILFGIFFVYLAFTPYGTLSILGMLGLVSMASATVVAFHRYCLKILKFDQSCQPITPDSPIALFNQTFRQSPLPYLPRLTTKILLESRRIRREKKQIERFCLQNEATLVALIRCVVQLRAELLRQREEMAQSRSAMINMLDDIDSDAAVIEVKNKELELINKELDAFTYTASHDLKAPIRAIESFTQFLIEDNFDKLDKEGQQFLSKIQKNATVSLKLISDLLAMSRVSRIRNPFEWVDLNQLLDDTIAKVECDFATIEIQITKCTPFPVVWCDRIKMGQVLYNLINNGIKYSAKTVAIPSVDVSAEEDAETVRMSIQDNGIGIKKQNVDKIFMPFTRLHSAKEYEGTGIGLNIVKRIVEQHNGSITVRSEVGRGTTFIVAIPKAAATTLQEDTKQLPM